jgi:hypothetical protein
MALGLFTVLACGGGCGGGDGPELATVKGTITLDGKPLAGAEVSFQPESAAGSPALGETDQQGRYEMRHSRSRKGAQVGLHKVRITTAIERENDRGKIIRARERVPAKYNVKTELVREVKSGSNTIDFELDSIGNIVEQRK